MGDKETWQRALWTSFPTALVGSSPLQDILFLNWAALGYPINCVVGAWCPILGERETKALSWLGCRSLENSVLQFHARDLELEGCQWTNTAIPRTLRGANSHGTVLRQAHRLRSCCCCCSNLMLRLFSRAKLRSPSSSIRIIFLKGSSQSPSIQCNILQQDPAFSGPSDSAFAR